MAYADHSNGDSFSTLHPDIIQTQILTRLDGPTLTSTASTSSYLRTLCSEQKLWQELSIATWPSTNDPRVVKAISSFPSGYRSFFADSYPFTEYTWQLEKHGPPTRELISAVDLYYRGELIYSKVQEMETESGKAGWFLSAPFLVDMLDPRESVKTRIRYPGGDYEAWVREMEESMRLNWILIDPVKKRAANISSRDAVSAKRNWLTGDLEIRFSTVVAMGKRAAEVAMVVFLGGFAHILEEQWQVDVLLKAGDSDPDAAISAHKLVLAARSKVFKKMLEEDECKTSSEKEIITLSEMKHEEVKALVEFIYSNGSMPCAGHARSLYLAADKYEIPHMRDLCRNELISSLNASNALDVYELAQIPFDDALNKAALDCIRVNITTIAYSDELKLFAESNPNLTVEIMKAYVKRRENRNYSSYYGQ